MESSEKGDYVFISYSRKDSERIEWLLENLRAARIDYFIDRKMSVGSRWESILQKKIVDCGCLLVIWSTNSTESEWVTREIREAINSQKTVVPVRIDPVNPPTEFHYLNVADLSRWLGNSGDPEWKKTLATIRLHVIAGYGMSENPRQSKWKKLLTIIKKPVKILLSIIAAIKASACPTRGQDPAQVEQATETVIKKKSRKEFDLETKSLQYAGYLVVSAQHEVIIFERRKKNKLVSSIESFIDSSSQVERIRLVLVESN